jgi:V/A-type H+-transporting ATPase subunit G/H
MRDLVQEILDAEKKAEELLQHAREEASRIVVQADIEAKAKVAEARARAQELQGQTVQKLRAQSQKMRKQKIEKAEQECRAQANRDDISLDDLVDQVAQMIIETDLD